MRKFILLAPSKIEGRNVEGIKTLKLTIFTAVFGLGVFAFSSEAQAAGNTYYAAPSNHNPAPVISDDCTVVNPCALNYAINTKAQAGDIVLLKDGVYTEGGLNAVLNVAKSNLTVKAEHDGKVTIDGQGSKRPCFIGVFGSTSDRVHNIHVAGIICRNSSNAVFTVHNADDITVKRVSAYDAGGDNPTIFGVQGPSTNVLVEDVAITGKGRSVLVAQNDCNNITFRRVWSKFSHWDMGVCSDIAYTTKATCEAAGKIWTAKTAGPSLLTLYGANNSRVENSVFYNPEDNPWDKQGVGGGDVWANYGYTSANNNNWNGNVTFGKLSGLQYISSCHYQITGNSYSNEVLIGRGTNIGVSQSGDDNMSISNMTVVDTTSAFTSKQKLDYVATNRGTTLKNSVFLNASTGLSVSDGVGLEYPDFINNRCSGGTGAVNSTSTMANSYNNYYNVANPYSGKASKGIGELCSTCGAGNTNNSIDPNYDVSIYGKGAYLIRPSVLHGQGCNVATSSCPEDQKTDIGAEVLYQYENGVLMTDKPLWPWPMESRICAETGYSVTYENPTNCKQNGTNASYGGGLWKTLEGVYLEGNPADVNGDTRVNIKDIQICIKAITVPISIPDNYLTNCKKVALPDMVVNIKDIQAIVKAIIGG